MKASRQPLLEVRIPRGLEKERPSPGTVSAWRQPALPSDCLCPGEGLRLMPIIDNRPLRMLGYSLLLNRNVHQYSERNNLSQIVRLLRLAAVGV